MVLISLGSFFSRQPAPLFGLDISGSSVKLVELNLTKAGQLLLVHCASVTLEPGWMVDGNIEKFDYVAAAVRRLVQKSGTLTTNVAMALPPSSVITKKITLPDGLSAPELEMQVEVEASQYIPFPLEEVSLDFFIVGPSAASVGDIDVLIAASRKEKVQDVQGLAEAAGLKPVLVDIASYASRMAATRLIKNQHTLSKGSIVALFEIGARNTRMQVIRDAEVLYDRDQAFGGAQLTELIMRQYGFSLEEAESKKRNFELPPDYDAIVLTPFIESLVQEIGHALQFFFTSTPHNKVDAVLLAGGSAVLSGLTAAVTEYSTFPCSVANPFEGMAVGDDPRLKKVLREAPTYLTACGLALRRFMP
jgi:type IV pilus assembly protein PilM